MYECIVYRHLCVAIVPARSLAANELKLFPRTIDEIKIISNRRRAPGSGRAAATLPPAVRAPSGRPRSARRPVRGRRGRVGGFLRFFFAVFFSPPSPSSRRRPEAARWRGEGGDVVIIIHVARASRSRRGETRAGSDREGVARAFAQNNNCRARARARERETMRRDERKNGE